MKPREEPSKMERAAAVRRNGFGSQAWAAKLGRIANSEGDLRQEKGGGGERRESGGGGERDVQVLQLLSVWSCSIR